MRHGALSTLSLFLYPAVSVELLSGNTSLAHFLNPLGFIVLNLLYGGAAVLVRETVVRLQRGLGSIVIFGLAYGIVNEGLASKGLFDPNFYAVAQFGLLGAGRAYGVNWAWAAGICAFHALMSIALPIVLTQAAFPGYERRLTTPAYLLLLACFGGDVVILYHVVNATQTPAIALLASTLTVIGLFCIAAIRLPNAPAPTWAKQTGPPMAFVQGVAFSLAFFFVLFGLHRLVASVALYVTVVALLVIAFVRLIGRTPRSLGRTQVARVAGVTAPMAVVALRTAPIAAIVVAAWLCISFAAAANERTEC